MRFALWLLLLLNILIVIGLLLPPRSGHAFDRRYPAHAFNFGYLISVI